MTYRLTCSMMAPVGINLALITPSGLNFRVLTPDLEMRRGAETDYSIRWLGLPLSCKTLITAYAPPRQFVDEQARGPFLRWRHTHSFRETAEGTEVRDQVDYRLPPGLLGRVAHALSVRPGIVRYRQHRIAAMLAVPGIVYACSGAPH